MSKKILTNEEMFCANFRLREYFKNLEYRLKKKKEMGEDESFKIWERQREKWIEAFKQMDIEDLKIIYYIQNIRKFKPYRIVGSLKKISDALESLNDAMGQEDLL